MSDLTIQGEVVVKSEGAESAFDRVGNAAEQMSREVAGAADKAGKAVDGIGSGAAEAAQKFTRGEAAIVASAKRSTEALQLLGKAASEKLEFKIDSKGFDRSKFEPALQALREVEAQAERAQQAATGSLNKMGVSAGQTQAALRQLPAQFSDIVVSLQAGQAPLTVFLQQGAQIKDSFGGAGNAVKAMGGYVMGLISPYTLAAAAVAALGVALYSLNGKDAALLSLSAQLRGTGRDSVAAVQDIKALVKELNLIPGVSKASATAVITEFAKVSGVGGEMFKSLGSSVADFAAATGTDLPTAAKKLAESFADPAKGAKSLEDSLGTLTAAQLLNIEKMAEMGNKSGAQVALMEALKQATKGLASEAMTPLGKATEDMSNAWDKLTTSIGNSEAFRTANNWLAFLIEKVADLTVRLSQMQPPTWLKYLPVIGPVVSSLGLVGALAPTRGSRSVSGKVGEADAAGVPGRTLANDVDNQVKAALAATDAFKSQASEMERLRGIATKAAAALEALKDQNKGNTVEADALRDRISGVNEKLAELAKKGKSTAPGESEVASIRARVIAAQQYIDTLKTQGLEGAKLNEGEKLAIKLRQELSGSIRGVARANKEAALADAEKLGGLQREGAEIERVMKLEQKHAREYDKHVDAIYAAAESTRQNAVAQEAANAAYGKSKTAIEEMTLAAQKNRLTNLERLKLTGAETEALKVQIAEQERYVDSLKGADYKAMNAQTDELLRSAKEQAALYEDEARLVGLSALERSKVVALRQIELKYAKELARVDQMADGTAEQRAAKETQRLKVLEAKQIESSAVVAKVVEEDWAKTSQLIGDTLADYIMGGGKDAAQYLKRLFATLVLQPIVQTAVGGLLGAGPGAASGGSNALGTANSVQSMWSSFSGGITGSLGTSIAGLGATLGSTAATAFGSGIVTGGQMGLFGGALGHGAAVMGSGVAGGTAAGLGTMAGAALPWVAGAAALLSIIKSMDDSGTPHSGAGAVYSKAMGLQTGAGIYNQGTFGLGSPEEYSKAMQEGVSGIAKGLGQTLDAFSVAFGKTAGYSIATAFADDSSKDGAWGSLKIADEMGKVLVNWEESRSSKWAPREFADGEEGYKQYMNAVAMDVKSAFLAMDLPGWADTILTAAEDVDTLNAALQEIATIKTVFEGLSKTMTIFSGISDDVQARLLKASDGVDALAGNAQAFYEGFYSEGERALKQRELQMAALAGMGLSIDPYQGDAAKEAFRKTVEEKMAAGQVETVAQLLAMSGAFASTADYAKQLADETEKVAQSLRDSLISLEGRFAGGGFSRQYQANDAAAQLQKLLSGAGIQKDAGALTNALLSATTGDVEEYFREIWNVLDTEEARQKLVSVTGAMVELATAAESAKKALRDSLIGLEGRFSGGGFSRQYMAEDAAAQLQKLLSGVGIEKDAAGLASTLMSATASEVESYFREIWNVLPTDAAKLELSGLANTMLDLAAATDAARESAAQATAQAVSGAWANLGTASGWAAQYLGDSSGLQGQLGMVQASYQGATTVEGREAALGQIIALEQSIWQVEEQNRQAAAQAAQKQVQALQGQLSAVNSILGATQRLREYAEGLFTGSASGLSDTERLDVLAAQYSTQLTLAKGGDVDAMGKLQSTTGEYLALAQQLSGTQSDYSVLSGRIAAELASTAVIQGASAKTQADTLQAQLDAATSAAEYASQQLEVSAATKELIATQLKDAAKQFDAEMTAMQAQLQAGMDTNLLLGGLPVELTGVLNSTLVPVIGSIADAAMAAASMSAVSAEAARQAAAAASAAASAAAAAAIAAASKEAKSTIPGFASGGSHMGGLRIVGENGPELEATGPSRIWNQSQLASAFGGNSNAELIAEIRALRKEVAELKAPMERTAVATSQHAEQFDSVSAGGNALAMEAMK